jgi:hypothetical protein
MEGSLGNFAFELFKDSFASVGDGVAPKAGFPEVMERNAWWESHRAAGAAAKDDWWFFGFPAIGATIRARVRGLVEVLGEWADFEDIGKGLLVKVPVGVVVQFSVGFRVTLHGFFRFRNGALFQALNSRSFAPDYTG